MELKPLPAISFKTPAIVLSGVVDYEMYTKFRKQFDGLLTKTSLSSSCRHWGATLRFLE